MLLEKLNGLNNVSVCDVLPDVTDQHLSDETTDSSSTDNQHSALTSKIHSQSALSH